MSDAHHNIAAIVLAAGGSTRMGTPKQLLPYRRRSLLRHAAEVVVASGCRPAVAVLGAHGARLEQELVGLPVLAIHNADWEKGIGTSIRVGVRAIQATADEVAAVVVTVCDQPLLSAEVIQRLCTAFTEQRKTIVASDYGGTAGVPALFGRHYFSDLLGLPDREGAKRLIAGAGGDVYRIPFPGGIIDVDTPQDYERLEAPTLCRQAQAHS
jgi:molybdenum cofactor cytidylyltransferase